MQHERLDRLVVMQNRAKQIYLELECEAAGELATVNTDTGIDAYVFNLENMAKLEESYKQVRNCNKQKVPIPLASGSQKWVSAK